jgi:hypothetical protein
MKELESLQSIFKNRLFRIPDYQRGYAWTDFKIPFVQPPSHPHGKNVLAILLDMLLFLLLEFRSRYFSRSIPGKCKKSRLLELLSTSSMVRTTSFFTSRMNFLICRESSLRVSGFSCKKKSAGSRRDSSRASAINSPKVLQKFAYAQYTSFI